MSIEIAAEGPELADCVGTLGKRNDPRSRRALDERRQGPAQLFAVEHSPRAPDSIGRLLPSRNSKSTTRFAAAMAAASAASSAGSRGRSRTRSRTTTEALSSTRRSIRRANTRRGQSRGFAGSSSSSAERRSRLTTATSAGALTCPRVKNSQLSPKRSSKPGRGRQHDQDADQGGNHSGHAGADQRAHGRSAPRGSPPQSGGIVSSRKAKPHASSLPSRARLPV